LSAKKKKKDEKYSIVFVCNDKSCYVEFDGTSYLSRNIKAFE